MVGNSVKKFVQPRKIPRREKPKKRFYGVSANPFDNRQFVRAKAICDQLFWNHVRAHQAVRENNEYNRHEQWVQLLNLNQSMIRRKMNSTMLDALDRINMTLDSTKKIFIRDVRQILNVWLDSNYQFSLFDIYDMESRYRVRSMNAMPHHAVYQVCDYYQGLDKLMIWLDGNVKESWFLDTVHYCLVLSCESMDNLQKAVTFHEALMQEANDDLAEYGHSWNCYRGYMGDLAIGQKEMNATPQSDEFLCKILAQSLEDF